MKGRVFYNQTAAAILTASDQPTGHQAGKRGYSARNSEERMREKCGDERFEIKVLLSALSGNISRNQHYLHFRVRR